MSNKLGDCGNGMGIEFMKRSRTTGGRRAVLCFVLPMLLAVAADGVEGDAQSDTLLVRPHFTNQQLAEGGWAYNEANGHYYRLTAPMSAWDAQDQAERWGGNLITIDDASENGWLGFHSGLLDLVDWVWIGLSDEAAEGTWVWEDGSAITYLNWGPDQPNDLHGAQDHVVLRMDDTWNARWNDDEGDSLRPGVVEVASPFPTKPGTIFFGGHHGESATIRSEWIQNSANGHYYKLTEAMSPWDAQAQAERWGGNLVTINNAAENDWLAGDSGLLGSGVTGVWIGLSDEAAEGTWVWEDGSASTYRNWHSGQPNEGTGNQDHVELRMDWDGEWNDDDGSASAQPGIVEREGAYVQTSTGDFVLASSSFGQPCASYVARTNIGEETINAVRRMLFRQDNSGGQGSLLGWSLTLSWAKGSLGKNGADADGSAAQIGLSEKGEETYSRDYGGTGLSIDNPGTLTSEVDVDNDVVVSGVRVALDIEHTWDEDLEVMLRSPGGREVLLFAGVGGGGDNFGNSSEGGASLELYDGASVSIADGSPPFAGEHRPQGSLSAFSGQEAFGTWTLVVRDSMNNDTDDVDPPAAFRFIDEIYGLDGGTVVNHLEGRLFTDDETNATLAELYGGDELNLVEAATALVRDALRYAPFDRELRNLLLDIAYYRCQANMMVAQEKLVRAQRQRFVGVSEPGNRIVDQEIGVLEEAVAAYADAATPYYELFADGMGIDVQRLFPSHCDGGHCSPYGYVIFLEEVPGRALNEATYRDLSDNLVPVLDDTKGGPTQLLSGYKDLALLFDVMRDEISATRDLAKSYLMRGEDGAPSDMEKAQALVNDALRRMDTEGSILLGLFPDLDFDDFPVDSGLPEAIASWQNGLGELDRMRALMDGDLNLLGFREDFLMLVASDTGTRDSYDALYEYLVNGGDSTPLKAAVQAEQEASEAYANYRGNQDSLDYHLSDRLTEYSIRLEAITGVNPGPDPASLDPSSAYFTPWSNEGSEIYLQVKSIEVAANRIRQNEQEIANLKEQVEIEVQRRADEEEINADIGSVMVRYGNSQAKITEEIAHIQAQQVHADNMAASADSVSVGVSAGLTGPEVSVEVSGGFVAFALNAGHQYDWEEEKGELEAEKEILAAMEQAEIVALEDDLLDVNSQANIKTWMLRMKTLQLESQEAALLLNQEVARLSGLYSEKASIEARMAETAEGLASRYYADPTHRLRSQMALPNAQKAFERAQRWVFFLLRAFEFKHNIRGFETENGTSMNSVFGARTAGELQSIVGATNDFDFALGTITGGDALDDWLSFTEDILGYRKVDNKGETLLYTDPYTGLPNRTAAQVFRSYLGHHRDEGSGDIVLDFSTVLDNGLSFFRGPRFSSDGNVTSKGRYLDKINWMRINIPGSHSGSVDAVAGDLIQGGTQFIRNLDVGRPEGEPNHHIAESAAWSTRFWYPHDNEADWRFKEGLTASIVINLTDTNEDEGTGNTFDSFAERSVAATGWRLRIETQYDGQTRLRIDECDDIEIYVNHRAENRP